MVVLRPGSGKITCWMRNCALFAFVTSTTSIYASRRAAAAALSFRSLVLSSSTPQCRAPHPPHTRSPGTTASPSASRAFTNRLNR